MRPSVRPSRWCTVSRRLKLSSNFFLCPVSPSFPFFDPERRYPIPRGAPSAGRKIHGMGKFCDFRQKLLLLLLFITHKNAEQKRTSCKYSTEVKQTKKENMEDTDRSAIYDFLLVFSTRRADFLADDVQSPLSTAHTRTGADTLHAAAPLIHGVRPHDHVTLLLLQLHWLSVPERVNFKLCLLALTSRGRRHISRKLELGVQ